METWQRNYITAHLPALINDTVCSVDLLAILISANVLHPSEAESIESKAIKAERARELYFTLQQRVGGFSKLKDGLRKTNQTGALRILENSSNTPNPTPLKDNGLIILLEKTSFKGYFKSDFYKGKFEYKDVSVLMVRHPYQEFLSLLLKDIEILSKLDQHENIVRYFKTEIRVNDAVLALEPYEINLDNFARKLTDYPQININRLIEICRDIAAGLEYLHSNDIVHGNLNPTVILLVQLNTYPYSLRAKISNFCLAERVIQNIVKVDVKIWDLEATVWFVPEIQAQLQNDNVDCIEYSFPVDVFQLGCLYYFLLTEGKHPYGVRSRREQKMLRGELAEVDESEFKFGRPVHFMMLIQQMINRNPNERPLVTKVLSDSTFLLSVKCGRYIRDISF